MGRHLRLVAIALLLIKAIHVASISTPRPNVREGLGMREIALC
jgi:hypothetical protein